MKRIIVMLLALVPLFAFAQKGQSKKSVDERVEAQTERMAKDLQLSEEQKAQVTAINKKYADQAKELKAEKQAEQQVRREEAKQIADAREEELKAVLTEAQYAQHLEMKADKQEKRQAKLEKWKSRKRKGNPKQ